jgi:hypothetical protein
MTNIFYDETHIDVSPNHITVFPMHASQRTFDFNGYNYAGYKYRRILRLSWLINTVIYIVLYPIMLLICV